MSTSGFPKTLWIHLNYKVNPDIAIFGKALGNGYAITLLLELKMLWKQHKIL